MARTTFEMYAARYKKHRANGMPHEQAKRCVPEEYHQLMFVDDDIIDPDEVIYRGPDQIKESNPYALLIIIIMIIIATFIIIL